MSIKSRMMFTEMQAAKEWGISPEEWYGKSREERSLLVGFERVQARIEHVQQEEARRKARKAR